VIRGILNKLADKAIIVCFCRWLRKRETVVQKIDVKLDDMLKDLCAARRGITLQNQAFSRSN